MESDLGYTVIPARSSNWGGMTSKVRKWVVVHCTADDYSDNYPTSLGNYWKNNDTEVSVQYGISDTQVRQYVPHHGVAYQTREPGNSFGVGIEFAGLPTYTRAQWLAHDKMLRNGAELIVKICKMHDIPPTKLTVAELKAGQRGIITHADHTAAFAGTHTDPGPQFPMDTLMGYVNDLMEGDNMAGDLERVNKQMDVLSDAVAGGKGDGYKNSVLKRRLDTLESKLNTQANQLTALQQNVSLILEQMNGGADDGK